MTTVRPFYRFAILLPLLGFAIALAIRGIESGLPAGWEWIYPSSIVRGFIAYAAVAVWLLIEVGRRAPEAMSRVVWLAPPLYVLANWVIMLGLALPRGRVGELWAEYAGTILLRSAAHLVFGYLYLWLVQRAVAALPERRGPV